MLALKQILYPMDFSDRCLAAAPFVGATARRYGAQVTLLSVVQPVAWADAATPGAAFFVDPETLRSSVQERLDSTTLPDLAGVPVSRVALIGEPGSTVVEYAHAQHADLIMMPTHGYGPFRRMLLGSVTAKVLHDAHCPVWTGVHTDSTPEHAAGHVKNIVCAIGREAAVDVPVAKWAAQFAADNGASIRFVHVVPGIEAWPERQIDLEFQDALREQARTEIEKMLRAENIEAPLCVAAGSLPESVRDEARRHGADLVVIGRGVIHEAFGRLRTHTHAILREAPCPVVSV